MTKFLSRFFYDEMVWEMVFLSIVTIIRMRVCENPNLNVKQSLSPNSISSILNPLQWMKCRNGVFFTSNKSWKKECKRTSLWYKLSANRKRSHVKVMCCSCTKLVILFWPEFKNTFKSYKARDTNREQANEQKREIENPLLFWFSFTFSFSISFSISLFSKTILISPVGWLNDK